MPKIEQTIRGNYVAAHTFKFISRTQRPQPMPHRQNPGLGPSATIHL